MLGWLGVALVFAAVAVRFLRPDMVQWRSGLAAAGLACLLVYILSQWREVARSVSGRQMRFGALAAASVVLVLGILFAINYLASRHGKRWDLTAAHQFTLADQTKKVVQGLKEPMRVIVFARTEDRAGFKERLDEYASLSKHFNVEYIDPEKQPLLAQPYLPLVDTGTVVLDYKGRIERVNANTEQALTNGLDQGGPGETEQGLLRPGARRAHGRGFRSHRLQHDRPVPHLRQLRQRQHRPVAGARDSRRCDGARRRGAKGGLLPSGNRLAEGIPRQGGKVLFLLDPAAKPDAPPLTNITALLKDWGIKADDDVVINVPTDVQLKDGEAIDVAQLATLPNTDGTFVLAAKYLSHPLTQGLGRVTVVFRVARSISAATEGANGHFAQNLFQTTDTSWGETDLKQLMTTGQVARDPGKGDKNGPLALGAAVSAPATEGTAAAPATDGGKNDEPKRETRMAVIGDSDFASNGLLGAGRNADLFLNAINWLAQQEDMIAIRPRDPEDRRITLTAEQQTRIFWITIFIIPGLILLAGVQTWWRRR